MEPDYTFLAMMLDESTGAIHGEEDKIKRIPYEVYDKLGDITSMRDDFFFSNKQENLDSNEMMNKMEKVQTMVKKSLITIKTSLGFFLVDVEDISGILEEVKGVLDFLVKIIALVMDDMNKYLVHYVSQDPLFLSMEWKKNRKWKKEFPGTESGM